MNCHNINSDDTEDSQKELWTEIQCSDSKTLRIDGSSAIQIVNRYCSLLPQDRFSYLLPLLWYNKADTLRVATLQLPITSSLREKITVIIIFS